MIDIFILAGNFIKENLVLSLVIIGIWLLIVTEIIYFICIKRVKTSEDLVSETIGYKFLSIIWSIAGTLFISLLIQLIILLIENLLKILIFLGSILLIGALIVGWFMLNHKLTKKYVKLKIRKSSFKVGQKVMVRKPYVKADFLSDEGKERYAGKKVTISHIDKCSDCPDHFKYGIEEFPGHKHLESIQIKKIK